MPLFGGVESKRGGGAYQRMYGILPGVTKVVHLRFLMRKSFLPNAFILKKLVNFRFSFHRVKIATKKGLMRSMCSIVFSSG